MDLNLHVGYSKAHTLDMHKCTNHMSFVHLKRSIERTTPILQRECMQTMSETLTCFSGRLGTHRGLG